MTNSQSHPGALFVYGTLMEPRTRERILGRRVDALPALLRGYRRGRTRHFYIVRDPEATTEGIVLRGLGAGDFRLLDEYEEVPRLYVRERVEVMCDGREIGAWVYIPTAWATGRTP